MAQVPYYDALQDTDKVKVNAAIRYSMSQDVTFNRTFLDAVQNTENKLDNASVLPVAFSHHHQEAYQQTLDKLRGFLAQHTDKIPALGESNGDMSFELAAQRAEFRGVSKVKDAGELTRAMENSELKNVTLENGQVLNVEGKGHTTPRLRLEEGASNAPEAIQFKQFMRQEMELTKTQILFQGAGVTESQGNHHTATPISQAQGGISR